ncbi:MAG TPA: hypothetical protein VMZ91_10985 [Candidatus Paceibacterota bacterium]|nr:hypothetical protein [Candidatus Paceibacterota bacterium]
MLVARLRRWLKEKKAVEIDVLTWWFIAIAICIVMVVAFIILRKKDISAIEFIKNLLRFGR